ncbi:MAG: hypothetical protein WC342_08875, partial [Methanoregula sp.]
EQLIDIYAILLMFPEYFTAIQNPIQIFNCVNCPDRKGYILIRYNFIGSWFFGHKTSKPRTALFFQWQTWVKTWSDPRYFLPAGDHRNFLIGIANFQPGRKLAKYG